MGAWIEIIKALTQELATYRRPRMGAWIEMAPPVGLATLSTVAPVWGRGLKCGPGLGPGGGGRRPRMGAWIEIQMILGLTSPRRCRPRMGAWIEI